ncbi:MAG: hypothetical protein J1E05_00475 [Eubacterium sp.]|nr:hypothetical protein [Eubacterium sp.]
MKSFKAFASKKKTHIISAVLFLLIASLFAGCASFNGLLKREYTLMNSAVPIAGNNNLFYVPNEIVENTDDIDFYAFCDDLLISSYVYDEQFNPQKINLKRISLADGELAYEANITCGGSVNIQVSDNAVSVTDPVGGKVTVLNERLVESAVYNFESSNDYEWYYNNDTKKLFSLNNNVVYSLDLPSKERTDILTDITEIGVCGISDAYVVFTYIDVKSQMYRSASLNLESGRVEASPINGELWFDSFRKGENWILRGALTDGDYVLHTSNEGRILPRNDTNNDLLFAPQDRLLTLDLGIKNMNLYELDGSFISHCALPENEDYYTGRNLIWNAHWNGYFFIEYESDPESFSRSGKLLFWDLNTETSGSALQLQSTEKTSVSGGKSADPELYARAAKLSEQFGVDIRIADQCRLDYGEFTSDEENDFRAVSLALDYLEKALEQYPKGFFKQLSYGNVSSVRIELVTDLISPAEMPNSIAFEKEEGDHSLIVMDMSTSSEWEFYHEVSHIIDKRLEWDARLRSDAVYSNAGWLELQPKGFEYAYSYTDIPDHADEFDYTEYFVRDYAMISPTEDRATLLEVAMSGYFDTEKGSHLWNKLNYYSKSIRDCFDTTGWPETTAWEEALQ